MLPESTVCETATIGVGVPHGFPEQLSGIRSDCRIPNLRVRGFHTVSNRFQNWVPEQKILPLKLMGGLNQLGFEIFFYRRTGSTTFFMDGFAAAGTFFETRGLTTSSLGRTQRFRFFYNGPLPGITFRITWSMDEEVYSLRSFTHSLRSLIRFSSRLRENVRIICRVSPFFARMDNVMI